MRLLLIGHGYLGRELAARFRESGWEVSATSLHGGEGALACDVGDPDAVRALAHAVPSPHAIIHCAATGRGGADAYRQVYLRGCQNLIDSFPAARLVFVSSSSVYAHTDGSVVDETSPTLPERETAKLLLESERLVLGANGIVARLAGIYGPARSVILGKLLSGQAVIEEDGRRFLNQIHRDDAVRALHHLVSLGAAACGQVFNVCDSTPLTQRACYQRLSGIFGLPLPPTAPRDLNRKRGWTHKQVSNAKLRATGWTPEFPCFLDAAPGIAPTLQPNQG
jgi:nucleoside-diphosphate-sugar epimerase